MSYLPGDVPNFDSFAGVVQDPAFKQLFQDVETVGIPQNEVVVRKILRGLVMLAYFQGNGPLLETLAALQGSQTNALAFAQRKE